jgi:hypothetical protein
LKDIKAVDKDSQYSMKQVTESQWTVQEISLVKAALANARNREVEAIVQVVRQRASKVTSLEDVWQLNDFLSARRFDLDGKYNDRDNDEEILFALAQLTKDGWLGAEDLVGLEASKLSKIAALTRVL